MFCADPLFSKVLVVRVATFVKPANLCYRFVTFYFEEYYLLHLVIRAPCFETVLDIE